MELKPDEIKKILIGKTISDIKHHKYIWPLCIDEIHFTDGSFIELSVNADEARIDSININGEYFSVEDQDNFYK